MVDLHMHTKYSDGTDSVSELVTKVLLNNTKIFAIADHDTIEGCKEVREKYQKILDNRGIKFINAVEISTDDMGKSVHLLAYNFDLDNKVMQKLLKKGELLRKKRVEVRLDVLKRDFGFVLPQKDVDHLLSLPSPGKPYIAVALVKNGFASSYKEAMNKYLYHKFPSYKIKTIDAIRAVKQAGGISVYAHPFDKNFYEVSDLSVVYERVKKFTEHGLDGIECFYHYYDKQGRDKIKSFASEFNLALSGGSDYHGEIARSEFGVLSSDGYKPSIDELSILKLFRDKEIDDFQAG